MSLAGFHTASPAEVQTALDWAAQEGWNPGLEDATAFYAADPEGFFVARVGGEMVAAICVVNHSADMAFLGLYLCRPAYRGQGIGFGLWRHALKHAGGRTVGLDGVAAQQENYARSGFVPLGATLRYCGPAFQGRAEGIRPLDLATDRAALHALDHGAVGFARRAFLDGWITDQATRKTVVIAQDGAISGFATARLCQEGCKIGPIVAPDPARALALLAAGVQALGADRVQVDVPDARGDFRAALAGRGFEPTFETARMYRGAPPSVATPAAARADAPRAMAIATMELG